MTGSAAWAGDAALTGCLGEWVSEYVDGSLPARAQLGAERHLVACMACCAEVALERRLRSAMKSGPDMSQNLMGLLISVSQEIPVRPKANTRRRPAPWPGSVDAPAAGFGPGPLSAPAPLASGIPVAPVRTCAPRTLTPGAPAQHRSALRAAMLATAAAGASMAAVWSFSLAPAARPAGAVPAGNRPAPVPANASPAQRPAITTLVVHTSSTPAPRQAQSTP